ncbi:MAG: aminotransferase, partial [Oscillospiraceae bacterium]|nr:aminotransferase [Oscillospiraceae bacterium]
MTKAELQTEKEAVQLQYDAAKALKLKLNMARGKPGKEQLDLVSDLL